MSVSNSLLSEVWTVQSLNKRLVSEYECRVERSPYGYDGYIEAVTLTDEEAAQWAASVFSLSPIIFDVQIAEPCDLYHVIRFHECPMNLAITLVDEAVADIDIIGEPPTVGTQ